jgi:hypothetical protein
MEVCGSERLVGRVPQRKGDTGLRWRGARGVDFVRALMLAPDESRSSVIVMVGRLDEFARRCGAPGGP